MTHHGLSNGNYRTLAVAGAVGLLVLLLVLPQILQVPGVNRFARSLQDALHVPLFFVIAGLAWYLGASLGRYRLLVVTVLLVIVAGSTELLQNTHGRVMSMADFLRNMAGLTAGLLCFATPRRWQWWAWGAAAALVLFASWQFLTVMVAYLPRW